MEDVAKEGKVDDEQKMKKKAEEERKAGNAWFLASSCILVRAIIHNWYSSYKCEYVAVRMLCVRL